MAIPEPSRRQFCVEVVLAGFYGAMGFLSHFLTLHATTGIFLTKMAIVASAKSNIMKSIILAVKKCLFPANRQEMPLSLLHLLGQGMR